jgi:multisubunit Na+/H+ antiporter MnhF subunit
MFLSRHRRGRDRFVWIKLGCLVLGGVLGLVDMRRGGALLVDVAIVIVLAGFALRFVPDRAHDERVPAAEQPAPDP